MAWYLPSNDQTEDFQNDWLLRPKNIVGLVLCCRQHEQVFSGRQGNKKQCGCPCLRVPFDNWKRLSWITKISAQVTIRLSFSDSRLVWHPGLNQELSPWKTSALSKVWIDLEMVFSVGPAVWRHFPRFQNHKEMTWQVLIVVFRKLFVSTEVPVISSRRTWRISGTSCSYWS